MADINFEKDMYIDVTALDVEWVEQSELAMRYGRLWADAKEAYERAVEDVKLVKAELTVEAGKNPDKYLGVGVKPTGANVEAAVLKHKDYQEAKEDMFHAQKHFNLLEVAKNEICFTRKSALENLVVLHGQQYFAGPKVPRDLKLEMDSRRKLRDNQKSRANSKVRMRGRNKE